MDIYTQIAEAIFAKVKDIQWASALDDTGATMQGFATTGRRVRMYSDAIEQPAMYLTSATQETNEQTNRPSIESLQYKIIVYHKVARESDDVIPANESNAILAAVKAAFKPQYHLDGNRDTCTLNGLVHKCAIHGTTIREDGDLDGQGLLVIPLLVKLP